MKQQTFVIFHDSVSLLGSSFSEFAQLEPNGIVYVYGQQLVRFCSFWSQGALEWQERASPSAQRLFTCFTIAVVLLPKASHVAKPRVCGGDYPRVCVLGGELYSPFLQTICHID